jgi:hypothetical protein
MTTFKREPVGTARYWVAPYSTLEWGVGVGGTTVFLNSLRVPTYLAKDKV